MTEPNSRQPVDLLEQAVAALHTTPVPAGPSAELVALTTRALQQAGGAPEQGRQPSRRKLMFRIAYICSIAGAAAVLLALGVFFVRPGKKESADVEIDGTAYHIQGPFTHQDLTVFLLCSDFQDGNEFLTLDEGLKEGLVTITEQEQERVGALRIENQSDHPLYLQEGERLIGGKQDRTIITSLVIPPKSGKTSVPTFCVEHNRWVEGDKGKEFGFSVNPALAPKGVRGAAKVEGSQDRVWGCVAAQKVSAHTKLQCPNTNSSVNEMLDAPQVQAISEEYAAALEKALDRAENSDAVGMAIVFNGHIEEVNLYPNRALFRKLFPRLIRAYAIQAALLKDQAKSGESVTDAAVAQFLQARDAKSQKTNSLDAHNDVQVNELDGSRFQCTTHYNGRSIHWQLMAKNREGATAGAAVLGSDW
jgi:ARG and Rhodanese-Phosphatase-superfamily-associated Protein domain